MNADIPGPGKFEGNISLSVSERLYEVVNESGADEFFGSVDEGSGWYGLIRYLDNKSKHYIVREDNNGFFYYREFSDLEDVNAAWEKTVEKESQLNNV